MWNQVAGALGPCDVAESQLVGIVAEGGHRGVRTGGVVRTKLRLVCARQPGSSSICDPDRRWLRQLQQCPLSRWLLARVEEHQHSNSRWPPCWTGVRSDCREAAVGGAEEVACEVQGTGRRGPDEGTGGHRRPVVGNLFGGAGWDRAVRGFRRVASFWTACGEEHEICFPLPRQHRELEEQSDPGLDSPPSSRACWRVFRTAATMGDFAAPAVLDQYAAAFRTKVERFLCVLWRTPGAGVKIGKQSIDGRRFSMT